MDEIAIALQLKYYQKIANNTWDFFNLFWGCP